MEFADRQPDRNSYQPRHKSFGIEQESLLDKYDRELKQMLSNKSKKSCGYVQPLRSQLFLDWG